MQPFDDITPEETERQNQPVIDFLNRVSMQSVEDSQREKAQILADVRARLLTTNTTIQKALPSVRVIAPQDMQGRMNHTSMKIPISYKKTHWQRRLGTIAAVALVLLLIGSTIMAFELAQQKKGVPSAGHNAVPHGMPTAKPADLRSQAYMLVQQFHVEVKTWADKHPYYNTYDGHTYALNNAYMQAGLGDILDADLANAQSDSDFRSVIDEANNALLNLHMLEADYNDPTPYNQIHQSDIPLLIHYKHQKGLVIVVSLVEQSMRIYQDGRLTQSFQITTGKQAHPSLPGNWFIEAMSSPTIFKSAFPKSSPDWYPDTKVNYAMQYHTGGYFINDAVWRHVYGPGTQFPHKDTTTATDGSYASIDMAEADANWLYHTIHIKTPIVIY